jgi:hypothetical protein
MVGQTVQQECHDTRGRIGLDAELIAMPAARLLARCPVLVEIQAFNRSMNLITESDEFISITTSELDPGPFSVVIKNQMRRESAFERLILPNGQAPKLSVGTRKIDVGNLSICLDGAHAWSPLLAKGELAEAEL